MDTPPLYAASIAARDAGARLMADRSSSWPQLPVPPPVREDRTEQPAPAPRIKDGGA